MVVSNSSLTGTENAANCFENPIKSMNWKGDCTARALVCENILSAALMSLSMALSDTLCNSNSPVILTRLWMNWEAVQILT